jgi:hypothetical protein
VHGITYSCDIRDMHGFIAFGFEAAVSVVLSAAGSMGGYGQRE